LGVRGLSLLRRVGARLPDVRVADVQQYRP